MKKKIYHFKVEKLVRDKIPSREEIDKMENFYVSLSPEEYAEQLKAKLIEEANEVINSTTKEELTVELADLLEVLLTLAKNSGISYQEIESAREIKKERMGGFDGMIYVSSVKVAEDSHKLDYYLARPVDYPQIEEDLN